jgi:hypothetical protein
MIMKSKLQFSTTAMHVFSSWWVYMAMERGAIASILFIFMTILLQIEAFVTTTQRYTSYRVVDV